MGAPFKNLLRLVGIGRRPVPVEFSHVAELIAELKTTARAAGQGSFTFTDGQGTYLGFVQLIVDSPRKLTIHRVWTPSARQGRGRAMMRILCDLADRHDVELSLKVIPLGRKPYPMSREQLKAWYERQGFSGEKWRLLRKPMRAAAKESQARGKERE
jgi:hypothetical protein